MHTLGKYFLFLLECLRARPSMKVFFARLANECFLIGISSVFIMFFISIALGVVSSLQMIHTLKNNIFFIESLLGFGIRDITIAELAPTVTVLIFAGRVGSSIAGELGSMKITEQIDALEVMGINSKSYLVLPKIVASLMMYPLLVAMSAMVQIVFAYIMSTTFKGIDSLEFIKGLRSNFSLMPIYQAFVKAVVFAFLISSIASYVGYNTKGGALELGKRTTRAVTASSVASLIANYLIVQLFL